MVLEYTHRPFMGCISVPHIVMSLLEASFLIEAPSFACTYKPRPLHDPDCFSLHLVHIYWWRQPRVFQRLTSLLFTHPNSILTRLRWLDVDFFSTSGGTSCQCWRWALCCYAYYVTQLWRHQRVPWLNCLYLTTTGWVADDAIWNKKRFSLNLVHIYWWRQPRVFRRLTSLLFTHPNSILTRLGWLDVDFFSTSGGTSCQCLRIS